MKLDELFPESPEFTLKSTGKTYTLRLPNLEDRARFKDIAGNEQRVNEIFKNLEWDKISIFVYRLMIDKSDFMARDEKSVTDEGEEITQRVMGPVLLMRACQSIQEAISMLTALVTALRASDPLIDEAVKSTVEKKSPKK